MGDVTLRQHYVWRKYLRAWSTPKEQIFSLLIEQNKVIIANLMRIAQSNSFYRMNELSPEQIVFIKQYISKIPAILHGLVMDLLICYESYSDLSRRYRLDPNSMKHIPSIESELRKIEIDTFENIHGIIEGFGSELIECKNAEALKKIVIDEEKYYNAMTYLCIQYSRTNAMRKRFEDGVRDKPNVYSVVENAWPLLSMIAGFQICYGLIHNNPSFYYVNNATRIPFITGDQPLINSVGDKIDSEGYAVDLVFYYPISPKSAIMIEFSKEPGRPVYTINADDSFVQRYNSLIASNADFFLFSNEKEGLESYIKP